MPDSSSIGNFNKTNFSPLNGAPVRGNQINQIGTLLNNISAQNGVRAVVNSSGIKLYGTGNAASLTHRFKIVNSTEDDSEANPCLHIYKGDWIRNDQRISLTLTEDPESAGTFFDYYIVPFADLVEGNNYVYVSIDDAVSPTILEAGVTDDISLVDYEPSASNNKFRIIGLVVMEPDSDGYTLLKPLQFIFEDIKDNINTVVESEGVVTDGGLGFVVKVITDMRYDTDSTFELQYKYRDCTVKMGWIEIGLESEWEKWADTAECDSY